MHEVMHVEATKFWRRRSTRKMNTIINTTKKIETKVLLSTLWIIVMINMLKADILSLYIPGATQEVAKTSVSTGLSIPQLMLGGAIIGELAIGMIILSRVLKHGMNRWLNILVSIFTIAYIWLAGSSFPHYTFIAVVETICLLLILWNAWKWTEKET
jgi:hypothetical protein